MPIFNQMYDETRFTFYNQISLTKLFTFSTSVTNVAPLENLLDDKQGYVNVLNDAFSYV